MNLKLCFLTTLDFAVKLSRPVLLCTLMKHRARAARRKFSIWNDVFYGILLFSRIMSTLKSTHVPAPSAAQICDVRDSLSDFQWNSVVKDLHSITTVSQPHLTHGHLSVTCKLAQQCQLYPTSISGKNKWTRNCVFRQFLILPSKSRILYFFALL